ncbi:hypothetical protein GOV14_00905 [Candidatus Pacearchaeota archaeon]|nr:hypothetical protein [Candidatus Pacearchaeota archaeon]
MTDDEKIIGYIENGIVIDHIPQGRVWQIVELLHLNDPMRYEGGIFSLGDGYESRKVGKKGILKVEGVSLRKNDIDLVALVAKEATISEIENGRIKQKYDAEIPEVLDGVVNCPNLNCITNDETQRVMSKIYSGDDLFMCHYCRSEFGEDKIKFLGGK